MSGRCHGDNDGNTFTKDDIYFKLIGTEALMPKETVLLYYYDRKTLTRLQAPSVQIL